MFFRIALLLTFMETAFSSCPSDIWYEYNSKCYVYYWGSSSDLVDIETATTTYCGQLSATLFYPVTTSDYTNLLTSGVLSNFTVSAWIFMVVSKPGNTAVYGSGQAVQSTDFLSLTTGQYWATNQPNTNVAQSPYQDVASSHYINDTNKVCVKMSSKSGGATGYEFYLTSCNEHNRPLCVTTATTAATTPKSSAGLLKFECGFLFLFMFVNTVKQYLEA